MTAILCLCLAAVAQEAHKSEPVTEKTADVPSTVVLTEEAKVETAKTEKPTKDATQEYKSNKDVSEEIKNEEIAGLASYYAAKFNGRRTASGEKFSSKLLTAAHLSLPFGTLLKVTNPANNKSVVVRVNDRGPYVRGRLLDLSRSAADLIGITRLGVARVELEILAKDAKP